MVQDDIEWKSDSWLFCWKLNDFNSAATEEMYTACVKKGKLLSSNKLITGVTPLILKESYRKIL